MQKMKTLLCTPIKEGAIRSANTSPVGLAFVAGMLEKEGYEVKIIDNYLENYLSNQTYETFLKQVKKYDPDIIGISCSDKDRFWTFKTADIIKREFPHIKIELGGGFSTGCHKQILEDIPSIDIVARGEGELTFLDIVKHVEKNKNLENVKGITYRHGENIKINEDRPFIQNLDELPWPAFHLLKIKKYSFYPTGTSPSDKTDVKHTTGLMFSKGCPFNCMFCANKVLWKRTYRIISPENAILQIKYFVDKDVKGFAFFDDNFVLNKKWLKKFAHEIRKEKFDIQFGCSIRVTSIDLETAEILREIGCRLVFLGIENGSLHVLKLMNKNITPQQMEKAVEVLHRNEIAISTGYIVNTPGETLEDITLSLKFFKRLYKKYSVRNANIPGCIEIYPGTDLERIALRNGFLNNFRWTQNYFEKRNLLMGTSPYTLLYENISIEYLMKYLIKECLRLEFYDALRPVLNNFISLITSYLQHPSYREYGYDNFTDKLNREILFTSWLLEGIKSEPLEKKAKHIYSLLNEILKLTFPKF